MFPGVGEGGGDEGALLVCAVVAFVHEFVEDGFGDGGGFGGFDEGDSVLF